MVLLQEYREVVKHFLGPSPARRSLRPQGKVKLWAVPLQQHFMVALLYQDVAELG